MKPITHQFEMFGFQKPVIRIPDAEKMRQYVREAKKADQEGKDKQCAKAMRNFRYLLQNFERRIVNKKSE